MKWHLRSSAIIVAALSLTVARADRGAIIAEADVDLQEPAQRALIAHNGLEEMLILQTDVQAGKTTKAVEFMPLPSAPVVFLAAEGCFQSLQEIVDRHDLRYVMHTRDTGTEVVRESTIQLVVAEQLGPHQVTVVEVSDVNDFLQWVEQFFHENDLGAPNLDEDLHQVVVSYIEQGLRFFVFDIITAVNERKTVQPLVYLFKSRDMYYPLCVTNLYGGSGSIELLLVAPEDILLHTYYGLGMSPAPGYAVIDGAITYRFSRSGTAKLTAAELEQIEPSMASLLKDETVMLGAVKYEGPLVFVADVNSPLGHRSPETLARRFLRALEEGDMERLDTLVTVPFALDHQSVIEDRATLMAKLAEIVRQMGGRSTSSYTLTVALIEDYPLVDEFDRAFAQEHLRRVAYVVVAEFETTRTLLYARQTGYGIYRIVGFSDERK